jgi:gluconate 2-dehydrogenase gamma chain
VSTGNAAQRRTLGALIDTLVPDDEYGPGGLAAGADVYVARLLLGNQHTAGMYRENLAALDSYAQDRYGGQFAELDAEDRTNTLRAVEDGTASGPFVPDAATFFAMAHHHMLEGMFGDPVHGGNRQLIGWKLLGYRGIKPIASAEDQRLGAPPEQPIRSRADFPREMSR